MSINKLLLIWITLIATHTAMVAQPGTLDLTFGTDGKTLVQSSSGPSGTEGMAVQSDGKIVAVAGGHSYGEKLIRLNADGSLDSTFGTGGAVNFAWSLPSGSSTYSGKVYDLAIQNIGGHERIILAGVGHLLSGRKVIGNVLRVDRYLSDGTIDPSFGNSGSVVINTGYALAVAVQSDQKIVTAGDLGKLVRLMPDGSLDTSFGTGGIASSVDGRSIAIDANGGILLGSYATVGKGNNSRNIMSVARYRPNGMIDTGFGSNGRADADFGLPSQIRGLRIDSFGNIVASGLVWNGADIQTHDFAVARFTSNGFADSSFSDDGRVTYDFFGGMDQGYSAAIQSDGRIVMTGQARLPDGSHDFGLVRFNYDGSVDAAFGNGGRITADVYREDFTQHAAIQMDPVCACEKIVMSGGSSPYISFARFHTF